MVTHYPMATPTATEVIDFEKYEIIQQICAGAIIVVVVIVVIWYYLRKWRN